MWINNVKPNLINTRHFIIIIITVAHIIFLIIYINYGNELKMSHFKRKKTQKLNFPGAYYGT